MIADKMTAETIEEWSGLVIQNLSRNRTSIQGQPHMRNLDRWGEIVDSRNIDALREVLTSVDRDAVEMREVSPMSGILTNEERLSCLGLSQ